MRILTLTLCIACAAAFGTSTASVPESADIAPLCAAAAKVKSDEARAASTRERLSHERERLAAVDKTGDKVKIRAARGSTHAAQEQLRQDLLSLTHSRDALAKLRDSRTAEQAKQDGDRMRVAQARNEREATRRK